MDYCIYDRFEECQHRCDGCPRAENTENYEYYKDFIFQLYREWNRENENKFKS